MNKTLILLCGFALVFVPARALADNAHHQDIVRVGKSIEIGAGESAGDVVCIGCSVHIAGSVTGDVVAIGGSVHVETEVSGDVVAVGGRLRLGPNAHIHGDAVVAGGRLDRDPTSVIDGEVSVQRGPVLAGVAGLGVLLIAPLIFMLGVGVVLSLICYLVIGEPRSTVMVAALRAQAGMAWVAGLAVLISWAILVTVFKWAGPVGPVMQLVATIALFLAWIGGYTAVSLWVGRGLSASLGPLAAVALGAVVIGVLQAIPVLGLIAVAIFSLMALGVAVLTGFGTEGGWLTQRMSGRTQIPPPTSAGGR